MFHIAQGLQLLMPELLEDLLEAEASIGLDLP